MTMHPGMPTDEQQDSAAEAFYGVDAGDEPLPGTVKSERAEAQAAFQARYSDLWANIQKLANDRDMEELLLACRDYFEADAAREEHPEVKACLTGAAEMCEHASFNFYASFK